MISPCSRARNFRRVGPSLVEVERLGHLRLRRPQEGRELDEVDAVLAVVALGPTSGPAAARRPGGPAAPHRPRLGHPLRVERPRVARVPGQSRADQPLEPLLGRVRGRHGRYCTPDGPAGQAPIRQPSSKRLAAESTERQQLAERQPSRE